MATYRVFKETAVPATFQPHSIYLIAPAARPDLVEIYVSNAAGTAARRTLDQTTVQSMIDAAIAAGSGGTAIADTIAARNAISAQNGQVVLVLDASADPTVNAGAATYVWRSSTSTWIKISEAESMDVVLAWGSITGRPNSTPAAIDTAVANSHTHANKTQLDKVGEDADGLLTYDGNLPRIAWDSVNW